MLPMLKHLFPLVLPHPMPVITSYRLVRQVVTCLVKTAMKKTTALVEDFLSSGHLRRHIIKAKKITPVDLVSALVAVVQNLHLIQITIPLDFSCFEKCYTKCPGT